MKKVGLVLWSLLSCNKDNTDPIYHGIPHIHGTRYKNTKLNKIKNTTDGNVKTSTTQPDANHYRNAIANKCLTTEVEPSAIPKNYRCSTDDTNKRNKKSKHISTNIFAHNTFE